MSENNYTIGELARLSGVSVRKIRFYSDRDLLPPRLRTPNNYRIYSDDDVARLDLIRALRQAGIGLDVIRKLLARRLPLRQVLEMRLQTLEAEIIAQRRIAATLRAALRTPDPTEADLRRLWTMTHLSQAQFRASIEQFYDKIAAGAHMDDAWKRQMIDAATPALPDEPTTAQIDAWNEITAMFSDEAFIAEMKSDTAAMWTKGFDPGAYAKAADTTIADVQAAMARGDRPEGEVGLKIARDWLSGSAQAMRRAPDQAFMQWHLDHYRKNYGRSTRYQQLMAILRGDDPSDAFSSEWMWLHSAMGVLLQRSA
ncbi:MULTISPECIES: MerR family transcriptional regulator [unclassified Beijerinckia]|uniref:MerR family transcriptional regulator n=1 Tax=unclassified Beijerinckia TaxID=2638183 RepID=UPI00089B0D82|nr:MULTISPECIES: MerR family transcriptional regulator [unclassified Beijerinckia]MDH7795441.1 DNA-binding transcriptional MerR regulator [Beijerinckia sp. GAS462]SEC01706.1 DNA-binding transcriptional regulator, MerR family [Beijerinckia sp. 28-YEA-48]